MNDPGKDLSEIRSMMEKSSKILSLSGLAGIIIGCIAIAGVLFARYIPTLVPPDEVPAYLLADAVTVLLAAIAIVIFFSHRMAKRKGLPIWNATAKHLARELAIPLATGGLFCVALIVHGASPLLPAAMLVFYGLALVTASKFTIGEVRSLGIAQLVLGFIAAFADTQGLNLWALGFGVGHIVFGLRVYIAYER